MNEIQVEITRMRKLIEDIGPIPATLEMHPMMWRDTIGAIAEGELGFTPPPFIGGLAVTSNPKLKPWACLVRDGKGRVIEVLRIQKQ